jgi:sec-independent protein translocase protein TatC
MPKLSDVFGLYAKMLVGLGLVFQMPTLVFFLAKMGIITARYLIRQFRYAVLLFVVIAAVITPTGDPLNLMIFTAPMIGLYGISIGIAGIVGRKTLSD